MKITLSALAVAGALVCLSTAALAAVPGPAGTPFENNAHLKAQMSNTSPNKIIIDGELITGVTGPENAYTKDNTADGALMITPLTGQDFTLFLETAGGISVSIDVSPKPGNGRTLHLIPASVPLKPNPDAKPGKKASRFRKHWSAWPATSSTAVPEGYTDMKVARGPAYNPPAGVQLTPERQLVGSHLQVVRYRMKNTGYISRPLSEKQFWRKGAGGDALHPDPVRRR
jgi:conjugal transfer pilus assembly protein TraK